MNEHHGNWRSAQMRNAEPESSVTSQGEVQEKYQKKMEVLRTQLVKLPNKKSRLQLLKQEGLFDGYHVSPEVPESWYEDAQPAPDSAAAWSDPRFGGVSDHVQTVSGRKQLEDFFKDPTNLETAIRDAEASRDFSAAAKLREHLKTELKCSKMVDGEELVFTRVLGGKDRGKWRTSVDGQSYLTDDPESFAMSIARRKAAADPKNEDGIPESELFRFTRKVQSGQLNINVAPNVYINLSLIARGLEPLTPHEIDEFASDIRNREMCDSAVLHSYDAAYPGSITPDFRNYLASLGQPLTIAGIQRAHETFALTLELEATKTQGEQPPESPKPQPLTVSALTPARISSLRAEEIGEISRRLAAGDPDLNSLSAKQIEEIRQRATQLADMERRSS